MPTSVLKPAWPRPAPGTGLFPDRLCFVARDRGGTRAPDLGPLRRDGTLAGAAAYGQGQRWGGPVLTHSATSDSTSFGADNAFVPTQGCTILLGYRKRDATARGAAAFGSANTLTTVRAAAFLPFSDGVAYWDFGGLTAGTNRLSVAGLAFGDDAWAFTTGARGMEIWQNGLLRASNAANPTRVASASPYGLGITNALTSDLADFSFFYMYGRQLSQADVRRLLADPFLPVRPPPRMPILSAAAAAPAAPANAAALLCGP